MSERRYGVEHALNMYANSFVVMPAMGIYDDEVLEVFKETLRTCHIYMIGLLPKVDFISASHRDDDLITTFEIAGKSYDLAWPMPKGAKLIQNEREEWLVVDEEKGLGGFPDETQCCTRLSNEKDALHFKVLYIGQAYGSGGSRNALDRLKEHATLQKIAVQGIPEGHVLQLLMLEILPTSRMFTIFNPRAKEQDQSQNRIRDGLDKLFSTTEPERITLFEASMIRYFQPKFNIEFKESFPSTNMKLLKECYEKDINSIIAEICFDILPFKLFSDAIPPKNYHISRNNLHAAADRKTFFMIGD